MTTDQNTLQDAPATQQGQVPGTDQVEQGTGTYDLVTVKQAAERLGCSVQTVRRLIRSGRLRADLVARPQGSAWRVMLPVDQDAPVDYVVQTGTSLERATVRDVPGITEIVAELAAARLMIAQQAERLGFLQAELQQRDETLRALSAPRNDPAPEDIASSPDEAPPAVDAPHAPQRSRLRRAWRWLAGTAGA